MPKDDRLDNYIYGNCPLCKKASYHKIKKPVFMFMDTVKVKIMVYRCVNCGKRWGMMK